MSRPSYSYTDLYYPDPMQVKYVGFDGEYHCGIAWLTMIIDSNTGETIRISDIITKADERGIHFDDAIIERGWTPIYW